ncbi:MAG: flagellar biosynthesis protein FlhB [Candidatus Azotimanducaceae bacterium]|uniref:Flagellar biosynthetic protein FlhB n=1 Tax=OM182 bacterium TaxID=2510334 RepID=A0A520RYC1_9GAMM|nr:flagellar biosynthesis protein FlhB [Gammaproteobacteria bacterium]RZO75198.1 MAG: flagellar biosynthesis protein FlhB [OM182 bacterium]
MAEDTPQDDKTEEPTTRRLEKAREDGQVLRSQDLTIAVVTSGFIATLYMVGSVLGPQYVDILARSFTFKRHHAFESNQMVVEFGSQVFDVGLVISPLFVIAVILAISGAVALDGFVFSWKTIAPKASKINPISGLARIFGLRALVELFKALMKFSLVAAIGGFYIYLNFGDLVELSRSDIVSAIHGGLSIVLLGALITSFSLVIIAAIDVPYQRFEFFKKLRMTKQEIKDEMKELEGQPEVKQKIKQKQREMAEQRMLQDVPKADVIITNPEHFAIALSYDQNTEDAPKVVAKGKGFIAGKIREIAGEHQIQIFESPVLARAIYFTTEIGAAIPTALYMAVAQVIAYVFSLNEVGLGRGKPTKPKPKVPKELQFDELGQRLLAKT